MGEGRRRERGAVAATLRLVAAMVLMLCCGSLGARTNLYGDVVWCALTLLQVTGEKVIKLETVTDPTEDLSATLLSSMTPGDDR